MIFFFISFIYAEERCCQACH